MRSAYISENKGSKTEVGLELTEASPLFRQLGFRRKIGWIPRSKRPGRPCAGSASACGGFGW